MDIVQDQAQITHGNTVSIQIPLSLLSLQTHSAGPNMANT